MKSVFDEIMDEELARMAREPSEPDCNKPVEGEIP